MRHIWPKPLQRTLGIGLIVALTAVTAAGAEERIAHLMSMAPEDAIGVKLSTPRRGCSGLAYSVDYVTEEAKRALVILIRLLSLVKNIWKPRVWSVRI